MYYFSVYDKKAKTYSLPSPGVNSEVYLRGLTSALLSNPNSPYVNYPEDFEVYLIGEYLEDEGFFVDEVLEAVCPIFVSGMIDVVNRMKRLLGRSEEDDRKENSLLN